MKKIGNRGKFMRKHGLVLIGIEQLGPVVQMQRILISIVVEMYVTIKYM